MIGVGTFKTSILAKKYINEVLESERISYGPFTKKFENSFSKIHDCEFGIMTSSGTCALMIALATLKNEYKWEDGDEVIVPAVTFVATSNIVIQLNMKPVFVDVEPEFYGINPLLIEAVITNKTRCIIPVHLFGLPCEMEPIMDIANKHNLKIVEDSCETMFAKYNGKQVGSFGDIGCFSTYVAHLLVSGVGGVCTTNNSDFAVQMRSLMNHGRDNIYISIDDNLKQTESERVEVISRRFNFIQLGYSFRVTEFEGALALAGLDDFPEMIKSRRENAKLLTDKLIPLSDRIQLPQIRKRSEHSFMMFPIVLKNESKTNLVQFLEKMEIETRDMLPLINQPYYRKKFNIEKGTFPVADWINDNGFYIGCHQNINNKEIDYIANTFEEYFNK